MEAVLDKNRRRTKASDITARLEAITLPSTRLMVGAALIVAAVIGVLISLQYANRPPTTTFAVANRPIPSGTTLKSSDFSLVAMKLSPTAERNAFTSAKALLGARTTVSIGEGEIFQQSAISHSSLSENREIVLPIAISRALGGQIETNEPVDVVVTSSATTGQETKVLLRSTPVLSVRTSKDSFGDGKSLLVRIAVPDEAAETALVAALDNGKVTLVRSPG